MQHFSWQTYLAPNWTPDWGPVGGSPCWRGQSARLWRMWPGGPAHCTPGPLRRELLALVHRRTNTFMLTIQLNQIFRKKSHDTSLKSVLLSSLNTARAGEVVLASHSLTVPSAEQERRRWCALLYTKPQTESVCPHNAPRSIDGSATENTNKVNYSVLIWKILRFKQKHTWRCYRRSHRGRCWDWGCSSTV